MAATNTEQEKLNGDGEGPKQQESLNESQHYRDGVERVVEKQIREGGAAGLFALQQHISDITGIGLQRVGGIPQCIIPINDIRGSEMTGHAKGEKLLRCKLAALYRLVDLLGWSQSIYNHLTVRVSDEEEHFLLNPFGLLYSEITASSLVKVDLQGNIVGAGSTNFGVNIAGFVLHSAIHGARPDAKCVLHIHYPPIVAVSSMKQGLMHLSQESLTIGGVSYHDYYGILIDPSERELIVKNLGPENKVMFLRNHGVVVVGETIEEAFARLYTVILACEHQVRMMAAGVDNLIPISDAARERSLDVVRRAAEITAAGRIKVRLGTDGDDSADGARSQGPQWNLGDMEFEAYMRVLDRAGYRTGYAYKLPAVRKDQVGSAAGYLGDEDDFSSLRKQLDGRRSDRNRWINSPAVQKSEQAAEETKAD